MFWQLVSFLHWFYWIFLCKCCNLQLLSFRDYSVLILFNYEIYAKLLPGYKNRHHFKNSQQTRTNMRMYKTLLKHFALSLWNYDYLQVILFTHLVSEFSRIHTNNHGRYKTFGCGDRKNYSHNHIIFLVNSCAATKESNQAYIVIWNCKLFACIWPEDAKGRRRTGFRDQLIAMFRMPTAWINYRDAWFFIPSSLGI